MVLPCAVDADRGNATTAARLAESLASCGYRVERVAAPPLEGAPEPQDWPSADILLALHAEACGPIVQAEAERRDVPFAVLFTGTDLNGKPKAATRTAVAAATRRIAMAKASSRRARDLFPEAGEVDVIHQAALPLRYSPSARLPKAIADLGSIRKLILVPAGIRSIKDPLRAVQALTHLASERPELFLAFAGPVLEPAYGKELQEALEGRPWACHLGAIPRQELLPLMRRADVVLSTSRSEGAAPNSLLEALLAGTPVLASDIPAHRELLGGRHCFRDDRQLRRRLKEILEEPVAAAREVRKLQETVRHRHGMATERLAWDRLLRSIS